MKKYTIAIAGSTARTTLCAKTLKSDPRFEISWILTPKPKPVGRKKIISPNPLDIFAKENNVPIVYLEKKVDELVKDSIPVTPTPPDFLLVVDFGYFIPNWLLNLPKIAPLNIHPSELPKWRGSSPGQFSILFNDKKSAVTLMVVNNKFDQGPIIHQDFFDVDPSWTQADYYAQAFKLICDGLGKKIAKFGADTSITKPQPVNSPTITAGMLKKDQTFIPWEVVKIAMSGDELSNKKILELQTKLENKPNTVAKPETHPKQNNSPQLSKLLLTALAHNKSLALTLERASKAFNPWPSLWTIVPTQKGGKRMKLIELELETTHQQINSKLVLKTVQIEGKSPTPWSEIKNVISEK